MEKVTDSIIPLTPEQEVERDIQRHPEFMANFYGRKLTGSENLTPSDALDLDRLKWTQNKTKAEKLLGQ